MNILIIEDEFKIASVLKEMIESDPNNLVVNICDSIDSSVNFLQKYQSKLSLIFMDIELADGQCFEIFEQVKIKVPVIFCTAYSDFLLKAFRNNGIDYILKPFRLEDISNAFSKLELLKSNFNPGLNDPENIKRLIYKEADSQHTILIHYRGRIYPVKIENVALVYTENETVNLLLLGGENYQLGKTLDQFESLVSADQYFRINRQMIVNRRAILSLESYFNQKVAIQLSVATVQKLIVSRLKVTSFMQWMENSE